MMSEIEVSPYDYTVLRTLILSAKCFISTAYVNYQESLANQALKRILKHQEASFITKLFLNTS